MNEHKEAYRTSEPVEHAKDPAKSLMERYDNPDRRAETGPSEIWEADAAWRATHSGVRAQLKNTGYDAGDAAKRTAIAYGLADEPGPIRALCFAHDAMQPHQLALEKARRRMLNMPTEAGIHEARVHEDEQLDGNDSTTRAFAERNGENWRQRYSDLLTAAESVMLTGKYMTGEGLNFDDPKTTAAGVATMEHAATELRRSLADEDAGDALLARNAGWKSNWNGTDTDPEAHAVERMTLIDTMAQNLGPQSIYAEEAAAGFLSKATAELDAAAMAQQLEASLNSMHGQNGSSLRVLASIAARTFNEGDLPHVRESADAMTSQDEAGAREAYSKMREAQEALAAAGFVLSNGAETAGLDPGRYTAGESPQWLMGEIYQPRHDPGQAPNGWRNRSGTPCF